MEELFNQLEETEKKIRSLRKEYYSEEDDASTIFCECKNEFFKCDKETKYLTLMKEYEKYKKLVKEILANNSNS